MLQTHYISVSFARPLLFVMGLALVALVACSSDGSGDPSVGESSSSSYGNALGEWPFDSAGETLTPSKDLADLDLENVIKIEYKNGSAPVVTDAPSEVIIEIADENVVVRIPNTSAVEYNFVLSGTTTNGSLKFYGDVRKRLYLNGVNITNSSGPAINIQKSERVIVHLVNGTQNFLTDGPNYNIPNGEQAKGAFFSEGKLHFEGSGALEVKGKYNHAIVADNDLEINNGKIIVKESANDGIHANDEIKITGGVLEISSKGDAIQSEKEGTSKIKIRGGKIKAVTTEIKSHGIASEGSVSIDSVAVIQVNVLGNGSKGIRARDYIEFKGGKTSIKVSGSKHTENDDESNPAGVKLSNIAADLFIEGGELTIKSTGSGAKGISVDHHATISDGNTDIEADDDGIKVKGDLKITGGTLKVTSAKKKALEVTGDYSKTGGNVTLNGN